MKYHFTSTFSVSYELVQNDTSSNFGENMKSQDYLPIVIDSTQPEAGTTVMVTKKDLMTPKLVAALDRCKLYFCIPIRFGELYIVLYIV